MRIRQKFRRAGALSVVAFVACGPSDAEDDGYLRTADCPDGSVAPDAGSRGDEPAPHESTDAGDAAAEDAGADGAPIEPPTTTPDSDIALVRFTSTGALDPTFGTNGVSVIDLGDGYVAGQAIVRDTAWSVARDPQGRLLVFGGRKGSGVRTDLDRVVVRTTPSGALDKTFATSGVYTFNLANQDDQARGGLLQPEDGKIVTVGFTGAPTGVGTQAANRVVLLRLYDPGTVDRTFGASGVATSAPFVPADPVSTPWGTQEVQGLERQSTGAYVTAGLGRAASSGTYDAVAFRYTAAGALDATWGTKGIFKLDVAGDNDRARGLVVLPDDRVLLVGSATPMANGANVDALAALLRADGTLDPSFGRGGTKLYDFGSPDEAFCGAAVSPDGGAVAAVGYRAGGDDDDATLLLLPLVADAGADVARVVPLSASGDDRFWSVAFSPAGMIYAAGFVADGADTRVAVARFDALGTLDASFGDGGIATVNVVVNGGTLESARGIVVQPDGKVVVVAEIEHL